jgi:adenylate kinase
MFNIVMLGSQGSGKGTQADKIAAKLNIPVVHVGQTLRAEVEKGTGLGRAVADFMSKGELVPDDMMYQILLERLSEEDTAAGVILDGYPRRLAQAESLDDMMTHLDRQVTHVIALTISEEEAIRRMSGRRVCSNPRCEANYHIEFNPPKKDAALCDRCNSKLTQRKDDNPEAIKRRLDLYRHDTAPLLDFYGKRGILHGIHGEKAIDQVEAEISAALGI